MMETVGVYLKRERESKNLSLGEVSRLTKISKSYLDCIEKDEFDKLPQGPYAKGYIASYSRLIGGNVDEAISLYEALHKKPVQTEDIQPEPTAHKGRKRPPKKLKTTQRKKPKDSLSDNAKSFFNAAVSSLPVNRFSFKAVGAAIKSIGSSLPIDKHGVDSVVSFFKRIASSTSWLYAFASLLGIAILVLAGFGFYHLFIYDPNPLPGAELQGVQGEETRSLPAIGSKRSVRPSTSTAVSVATDQPKGQADKKELEKLADQPENNQRLSSLSANPEAAKPQKKPTPEKSIDASKPARQAVSPSSGPSETAGNAASGPTTDETKPSLPSGQGRTVAGSPPGSAPGNVTLRVLRASVCSEIKNRMPAGVASTFPISIQRIYVWSEIEASRIPSEIRHVYYFNGQVVSDVTLDVRSTYWRTWSFKSISKNRDEGQWRVDIVSTDGEVLRRLYFEVR
jgi:cytoskeletal protein RodZ